MIEDAAEKSRNDRKDAEKNLRLAPEDAGQAQLKQKNSRHTPGSRSGGFGVPGTGRLPTTPELLLESDCLGDEFAGLGDVLDGPILRA